jgi:hypothetical protein
MEMAVKSMETAVEAKESMEMALGALPRPGRVPKQRLLSPETRRWRQRSYETLSGKNTDSFRVFASEALNRRRAMSEGTRVAHTITWHDLGSTCTMAWCGQL